ncbi:MAG: DivIVA domain-containing protein, partial [Acidimicrobiales bacterium]
MPEDEFDVGRLTAADVAARKFEKVRRGFDPPSVRAYLIEVSHELERLAGEVAAVNARADKLSQLDEAAVTAALGEEAAAVLHTARESAAAIEARAQAQAAQLVADAEEAANDIQARLDQERERAYAEGVAKAEETAGATLDEARGEARRLLDEAKAARNKVLGDLARRRKAARTQLEQLVAARDRLLAAFGVVRTSIDKATDELRVSLPEARAAADIAVRRAQSEPDDTVETLEHEIETLKLAGLMLVPDADDDDTESGEAAGPQPWTFQVRRDPPPEPELHQVDAAAPFEEVRVLPAHQEADGEVQPDAGTDVEVVVPAWPVAEPEPALEGEPEAEPEGEPLEAADEGEPEQVAEPEPPAPAEVDALFARLRAGREDKVAAARQVLEATSAHPVGVPDDATMLARRAEALTPVIASMTKRLKRLLADEQNEVLDLLRRHEGSSADGVVPDPDAHRDRWSAAVTDDLATAHAAGSGTAEA